MITVGWEYTNSKLVNAAFLRDWFERPFLFQDTAASIKKKLKKAFCEPGNITDNGILSFCKYVIIPVVLRGEDFIVQRAPENGGNVHFAKYKVCFLFIMYSRDLKSGFSDFLIPQYLDSLKIDILLGISPRPPPQKKSPNMLPENLKTFFKSRGASAWSQLNFLSIKL